MNYLVNVVAFYLILILGFLFSVSACSSPERHIQSDGGGQTDTDSDSNSDTIDDTDTDTDTDLVWDPENADLTISAPVLVFEDILREPGHTGLAFDGITIALSRSDVTIEPPLPYEHYKHTLMITFPWDSPEEAIVGTFNQGESECPSLSYGTWEANSIPFSHPDGFLLIESLPAGDPCGCQAMQSLWDSESNLLDGPHAYMGLFPEESFQAMDPNGIVDDAGVVTTANLKGIDFNSGGDEAGSIVIDLDRFGADGFHERLAHHIHYPWPDTLGLKNRITSGFSGRNIYPNGDGYTVLGMECNGQYYIEFESDIVLAGIGADGGLETEPTVVLNQPPSLVDPEWGEPFSFYTFAPNPDGIMVLAKSHYLDHTLPEYDDCIDDPHVVGYWSRLMDYSGEPLGDWTFLAEVLSHVWHNKARLAWSGRYYGVCYNDPFETHKFLLLDEQGIPLYEPADLFWSIPPVENRLLPCNVVAVNEDTFVVSIFVYTDPQEPYANGVWISRIHVNDVE